MSKRIYSDEDKARVYTSLTVHEGNVSRTARDTGVAESTVRDWKKTWEADGVPQEIAVQAAAEADAFITKASTIRDEALDRARALIPGSTKIAELTTLAGVLDDKIYRAKTLRPSGQDDGPKQIDARAAGELLAGFVGEAIRQSEERARSQHGAENTSQPALPAPTS